MLKDTMAEGTTKFQKLLEGTSAFWVRHKPRAGSASVLSGGLIGTVGVGMEIIERGIAGQPLNLWYAVKFGFCFTISCCKSWELWHQPPPPPKARTVGVDPEGHLR